MSDSTAVAATGPHGRIGVAVIGAGGRARFVVGQLLRDGERVAVRSVFDPDASVAAGCARAWERDPDIARSAAEAIDRDDVDWVMVFSPNAYHREHIMAGFAAGKHVFSEKPLATTIDDCRAIGDAHATSGLHFATGFVLRYAPLYRAVREHLDSGTIGGILSIDANENIAPDHGAYIMRNWRRHKELSGPHILEKCCHDLDLINWFAGSLPTRVAAFGGLDLFVPENRDLVDRFRGDDGRSVFGGWNDPHAAECPFSSEKSIMDTLVSIIEYRNGVKVQFQATMSNAIPERRMYLSGSEGTMIAELYTGSLRVRRLGEEEQIVDAAGGGHGGGDAFIMKELYRTMTDGVRPACSGEEGLQSAVVALTIDEAAESGRVIDLEPVWSSLGR